MGRPVIGLNDTDRDELISADVVGVGCFCLHGFTVCFLQVLLVSEMKSSGFVRTPVRSKGEMKRGQMDPVLGIESLDTSNLSDFSPMALRAEDQLQRPGDSRTPIFCGSLTLVRN